jgi:diguanylate cyclase (GGDEF)-like protein/PAS domain S-box-containing protein
MRGWVPQTALARLRLLFLVLALITLASTVPSMFTADESALIRAAGILVAVALGAHWVIGYRREAFPLWAEPLEAGAVFLVLYVTPGDPFMPLFGLVFRSCYGSLVMALGRAVLWAGALFAAHAPRGSEQLEGDISRLVGLLTVPGVLHVLARALGNLEQSERRLASLVQNSTDVLTVVDSDQNVKWQAGSILRVLGYDPAILHATPLLDLVHPDDRATLTAYFEEAEGKPEFTRTLNLRMRHADGTYREMEVAVSNRVHDASVEGFVLNMRDATERLRLQHELAELAARRELDATHDPLTGLPNRRKLFDRLEVAIATARREGTQLALLLLDLDGFKELNDTLGHQAGDHVLREMSPRLLEAAGSDLLVARLGGDEFAVLLPVGADQEAAELAALRVSKVFDEPFEVQGVRVRIRAGIGIAVFPRDAGDLETLVRRADIAMYSAKRHDAPFEFYDIAHDGHSKDRLALMADLVDAVADKQLLVEYQPMFDLSTGEITSAEALVRWIHPERGLLMPHQFISLAEQTGLMTEITMHILDDALQRWAEWRANGLDLKVAVNLSSRNLLDADLAGEVSERLRRWDVPATALQLEITETIIGIDLENMISRLESLRALDIELALDDFGTGTSSLSYLRHLPVQELKIDKSFLVGMDRHPHDAAIVQTIVGLAHSLGIRALAEGIENDMVRRLVTEWGCDRGQGFALATPMSSDELIKRARSGAHETLQ